MAFLRPASCGRFSGREASLRQACGSRCRQWPGWVPPECAGSPKGMTPPSPSRWKPGMSPSKSTSRTPERDLSCQAFSQIPPPWSRLQTLRNINANLDETNKHVSTGLRVNSAADNAAYWSIATTIRSDNGALGAVQDALGVGKSTVDTVVDRPQHRPGRPAEDQGEAGQRFRARTSIAASCRPRSTICSPS